MHWWGTAKTCNMRMCMNRYLLHFCQSTWTCALSSTLCHCVCMYMWLTLQLDPAIKHDACDFKWFLLLQPIFFAHDSMAWWFTQSHHAWGAEHVACADILSWAPAVSVFKLNYSWCTWRHAPLLHSQPSHANCFLSLLSVLWVILVIALRYLPPFSFVLFCALYFLLPCHRFV